jgi:osmotically-inducible protein OsmY
MLRASMEVRMRTLLALGAAAYLFYTLFGNRASSSVPDDVLIAKVRAALDKTVEHSGSIDIQAREGEIVLSGPIGDQELRACVRAVRSIPGVRSITNRLKPHAMA